MIWWILSGEDLAWDRRVHRWIRWFIFQGKTRGVVVVAPSLYPARVRKMWSRWNVLSSVHWIRLPIHRRPSHFHRWLLQWKEGTRILFQLLNSPEFRQPAGILLAEEGVFPWILSLDIPSSVPVVIDWRDWVSQSPEVQDPRPGITAFLWLGMEQAFRRWIHQRPSSTTILLSVSSSLTRILERWLKTRVYCLPNVPDELEWDRISEEERIARFEEVLQGVRPFRIGMYTMGGNRRNLPVLIQCARILRRHNVEIHVVSPNQIADPWIFWRPPLFPDELPVYVNQWDAGILLLGDSPAPNTRYSLAGKWFDYLHALLPQICVDYPEYRRSMATYPVGICVSPTVSPEELAECILILRKDKKKYVRFVSTCKKAREKLQWHRYVVQIPFFRESIQHSGSGNVPFM